MSNELLRRAGIRSFCRGFLRGLACPVELFTSSGRNWRRGWSTRSRWMPSAHYRLEVRLRCWRFAARPSRAIRFLGGCGGAGGYSTGRDRPGLHRSEARRL